MPTPQHEYLDNLKIVSALASLEAGGESTFEEWYALRRDNWARAKLLRARNMELLRTMLSPAIDGVYDPDGRCLAALEELSAALVDRSLYIDPGLYCVVNQALISYYRTTKDTSGLIRCLYAMGRGLFAQFQSISGVSHPALTAVSQRCKMHFAEAGAYRKFFDELPDDATKGYVIRSMANVSLARFQDRSEKIAVIRQTLRVLNDPWYRQQAPSLPWDVFLHQTHQQMVASRTLAPGALTSQDLADILDSSFVLYSEHLHSVDKDGRPNFRVLWPYYETQYLCGLITLPEMLSRLEKLIDQASLDDRSVDGAYGLITLPLSYCNTLETLEQQDLLLRKHDYLCSLNTRAFRAACALPPGQDYAFYFSTFLSFYRELEGAPAFSHVLLTLLPRCAPDLYLHSAVAGEAAAVICAAAIEALPRLFDSLPCLAGLTDQAERTDAAVSFVRTGALLHNVGLLHLGRLRTLHSRELFPDEHALMEMHALSGADLLRARPSTEPYADLALGHHSWYNGEGYPAEYRRQDCPARGAVDVLSLAVFLEERLCTDGFSYDAGTALDQAVEAVLTDEGRRFFPPLALCLADSGLQARLRQVFTDAPREICHQLYDIFRSPVP